MAAVSEPNAVLENLLRLSTKDRPCYCRMMSAPELSLRRIANLQAVTTPTNQM